MKKLAVILASLMVVACASTQKTNTSQANENNATASAAAAKVDLGKLNAEIQQMEKQSDYFDFNKYTVKSEYMNVIQKEAEFLKTHKNDVVTLQGNADERGSEKYNLGLGENRADAVAKVLEKDGVPADQIKMVSLGKDKPRLTCHKEKCWKENRRVDFLHNLG
ncbi:OmpA family protein [Sideroxydans lithotrophicus]|uniref:OmpA/MotB domain protein n=1 Tax=Sideroxydans lithotrophicus (strain ES-1) TaxID=580332 RepID=D5CPZ5_SIDLE|nr:OmpA family protein [Sideroxydans lithotrophicus]ADE11159.1 OmpA/MotB domain protein [Sideroxydans lithotrophicus ES-1]